MSKQIREQLRQFRIVFDLYEKIDLGELLQTIFIIALYKAAGDDQLLKPVFLVFRNLQYRVDRLFLRAQNKTAGIDQDRVALLQIVFILEKRIIKERDDVFTVNEILGTAKRDKSDFHIIATAP